MIINFDEIEFSVALNSFRVTIDKYSDYAYEIIPIF